LDLSEAARIALLQEMMAGAKRGERGGLLACVVGIIVSAAGFSTPWLAANSINLGILGLVIAAVGFAVYLHYARLYSKFVAQLAKIAFKTATPCPHCRKTLPEGEFDFCPFCGVSLNSKVQPQQELVQSDTVAVS